MKKRSRITPNHKKRGWKVYLSLGSNKGRRVSNLKKARVWLEKNREIRITRTSSVYESSPIGPPQRSFLNSVLEVQTLLSPIELLTYLKWIEKKMGRKKTVRWGPRLIDLDMISFGDHIMKTSPLNLPHPEYHKRKFVLVPLHEIAPNLKVSGFHETIHEILRKLTDPTQKVRLYNRRLLKKSNRLP